MTRSSTPKYEVVQVSSGTVALSGISKTEAKQIARSMAGDRKGSFDVRPVKRG